MELSNKTLIITGASSGIGAAAAELFAAEGANLVLGARRERELEAVAARVRDGGGQAVARPGDVTNEDYAETLVALAEERFGRLDGAFNNAGTVGDMAPVPELPAETWHAVLETNLGAAFFAAKHQIPALRRGGGGALVFTSSFVGHASAGLPGMGAYAAAKAGLVGLTRALAAEHGPEGLRITALLPGGTRTAMAGDDPEAQAFIAGLHGLKRMAEPAEIAQAALFLLSDRASFVTGAPLLVDGGVSNQLA